MKGIETISLLKWCNVSVQSLLAALEHRLEGFAEQDNMVLGDHSGEMTFVDRVYGLSGHSFIHRGDIDETEFLTEQMKRLRYLRDKFLEDLEYEDTILVYKNKFPPTSGELSLLSKALKRIGQAKLMVVIDSSENPSIHGNVRWIQENIIVGYIDRLAPYDAAPLSSMTGWLSICRNALHMLASTSSTQSKLALVEMERA
jgi:hypothetical protein